MSSADWLPFLSSSVGKNIPPLYSESMRGIFEEGDSYAGPHMNDGDIDVEATPSALNILLHAMLNRETLVTSGSVKTMTFKPRVTDWDDVSAGRPFTVYQSLKVGSAFKFGNMNATSLEMNFATGELLKAKLSVVGGAFNQTAPTSATQVTQNMHWPWDTTSISFNGSANSDVVDLTIKLDESIEPVHTLNASKLPSGTARSASRTLTVEGTTRFRNQTEYQQFLSQSYQTLSIHTKGVTSIQSGYTENLTIDIPRLRYEEFKPVPEGVGDLTVSFTARGKVDVTSGLSAIDLLTVTTQTGQPSL